jgi:uncharacterized tellurite resistance protein B-like protein
MRKLLDRLFGDAAEPGAGEEDLHRAALALLYEVARADGNVDEQEQAHLITALAKKWQLSPEEAQRMLDQAGEHAETATDLFDHTGLLREHWGPEPRAKLVAEMWDVAHADGHADPHEEQIIRRVADLLYVSHGDFIRGKLQARPDE